MLITLIYTTVLNESAEKSADSSAISSEQSAKIANQTLVIEQTPALTINCSPGALGIDNAVISLVPNSKIFVAIEMPWNAQSNYDYETCVIHNFGRQPVLSMRLPIRFGFGHDIGPGKFYHDGEKTGIAFLSGVSAQGTYTLWITNASYHLAAWYYVPKMIQFIEPSMPNRLITYAFPRLLIPSIGDLNPVRFPKEFLRKKFWREAP